MVNPIWQLPFDVLDIIKDPRSPRYPGRPELYGDLITFAVRGTEYAFRIFERDEARRIVTARRVWIR